MANQPRQSQPLLPRLHLFEINDQAWFPSFLRARVQAGLTHAWTAYIPGLQPSSPAALVADILLSTIGPDNVPRYTYVDFCAGAGGPTPTIERSLNRRLLLRAIENKAGSADKSQGGSNSDSGNDGPSYAEVAKQPPASSSKSKNETASNEAASDLDEDERAVMAGVDFILTDLHPHLTSWEEAARNSARLHYVARPVNAAAAPRDLVSQATSSVTTYPSSGRSGPVEGRDTFRLFNLAFHHFDDPIARSILRDTLATSSGFGIFELQERSLSGFATCLIFGVGIFLFGLPLYWWSPLTLLFVYIIPIVPLVLVFDGLVSSLRTRTPAEVEALLKSCDNKDFDSGKWEIRSGRKRFLWPTGHLNWIICLKKEE